MDDSANQLQRIVAINEDLKKVVRLAFGIGVMALNAILLARRAGDAARGFGVLSGELRQFSRDLAETMTALSHLTADSVATVTAVVKEARYLAILQRLSVDGRAAERVLAVRERQAREVEQRTVTLLSMQRRIASLARELEPVIRLGTVLARSARIEAAYGGQFARELTQVSAEFSRTIIDIEAALAGLNRKTTEQTA